MDSINWDEFISKSIVVLNNFVENPILVGIGTLVIVTVGFFLKKWLNDIRLEEARKKEQQDREKKDSDVSQDNPKQNEDLGSAQENVDEWAEELKKRKKNNA